MQDARKLNYTPSEKGETDDEDLFRLVVAIHKANNTSEFQVTTWEINSHCKYKDHYSAERN